ncbi:MAG: hypothetical protein P8X95_14920 [Anaerolineales bacterium]|jgi:hypothetical protein
MASQHIQLTPGHPQLKPIGRAILAIFIGIYGQMIIAMPIWYALGSPNQLGVAAEFGIKVATLAMECSVLLLIAIDKEPLVKYINLNSPGRILLFGLLAAIPLVAANRMMQGWIIRFVHGEFAYYSRLTGSSLGATLFLLLQTAYYFFEAFVLVYAYAKLAEGLRLWRPLPRWTVVSIGGLFLFLTWSLAHGFVITSIISFGIGIYLPFAFAALFEFTDSQVSPAITWLLFLAI